MTTSDHARQYLARTLPWPHDGEEPGFVNIHWTFRPKGYETDEKWETYRKSGRFPWSGRAARSVNEAVNAIQFALKSPDTRDIYVCMSMQKQAEEKVTAKGYRYYKPIRAQQNVIALKSLFIDIDFKGGDNGYDTPDDAIAALGNFLKETDLPKPSLIVSSGGGLHVYWTMMRPLTMAEWQPLAFALAEATKRHGLKCDTQCTVDSARILRAPGTYNCKSEAKRPVRIVGTPVEFDYAVERIQRALEPYYTITPSHLPARQPLAEADELAAGVEERTVGPVDLKPVVKECAFIRDALKTGGETYTNPMWNLTTLLATFCEDGRTVAHLMARKHPGYTKESTDELFDRKQKDRALKNLGWPSCATISATGCTSCQSCPHFSKGKSPLNLSFVPPPPAPASAVIAAGVTSVGNSDMPSGYSRGADGIIAKAVEMEDGSSIMVPLCSFPIVSGWLQRDPWTLHFTTHTDRPSQIAVPLEYIGTIEMRKCLQAQGMVLFEKQVKPLGEFLVSWIDKLKEVQKAVVSAAPFGWRVENGKIIGFTFGGYTWTPGDPIIAPPADPIIANQYSPRGELQKWIDAAKMVTDQDRPDINAILASAFASPLVRFTGHRGLMMSAYSIDSGLGKSTVVKVAQAVWGDPTRGVQSLDDTEGSVMNKVGEIQALPLYWDEIKTEEDVKKLVRITFQIGQGKEKSRLSRSAKQRETGTWQTLLITASNESLLDQVASYTKTTTAGIYRIFEFAVQKGTKGQISVSDATRMVARLDDNFGNVGVEYAKWLGANFGRIDSDMEKLQKELVNETGAANDERFWVGLIASLLLGATYANELGFTEINIPDLKTFLLKVLGDMRNERKEQAVDLRDQFNVVSILSQYLNQMRAQHTLYTNIVPLLQGSLPQGSIQIKRDTTKLNGVFVHIGVDQELVRISSVHFNNWLKERGYSAHVVNKALVEELGARKTKVRIGGGTEFAALPEHVIEIDMSAHPQFQLKDN